MFPQYYLPWELTEDQEDLIKDQIHDAETLIEKEIREFKQKKDQRLTDLGVFIKPASEQESAPKPRSPTPQKGQADMEKLQGKVDTDALPDNRAQNDSTNEITNGEPFEHANKVGNHHDKESDEAGDVMVEGDEDTVIY